MSGRCSGLAGTPCSNHLMSMRPGLVSEIGPVATGEVPPWVLALVDAVFLGWNVPDIDRLLRTFARQAYCVRCWSPPS